MGDDRDDVSDLGGELSSLAAATAGLDATPGLTEAIEAAVAADAEDPLARLAEATASLGPTEALTEAIVARLPLARPATLDAVAKTGPVVALVAAFAAAAAILFSVQTEREVDVTIVASVLTVEVGE